MKELTTSKPQQRCTTSSLLGLKAAVVTLAESGGGIGSVSVRVPHAGVVIAKVATFSCWSSVAHRKNPTDWQASLGKLGFRYVVFKG